MKRREHSGGNKIRRILRALRLLALGYGCVCWGTSGARAQEGPPDVPVPAESRGDALVPDEDPMLTMVPHAEWDRLWLSGQANFISQWHPEFYSPYQGKN